MGLKTLSNGAARLVANPPDRQPGGEERQSSLWALVIALFFSAWTTWVLYGYPRVQLLDPRTVGYALANLIVRSVIWLVPALLFIRYMDDRSPIEYLRLVQNWRRGIWAGLIVAAVNFVGSVARFGMPHVQTDAITWNTLLSTSCAIGLIEEVPFRGLVLQKLEPQFGWLLANLASALLFVLIHAPGWTSLGTWRAGSAIVVFGLGFVFGVAFRVSGSLWSAVIAHSTNDFFAGVLFGS